MEAATPSKPDKYDEYAVKRACETLMEAEEIKQDSKMMGLVKELMGKKQMALKKITSLKELRKVAEEKSGEEVDDADDD